MVSECRIEPDDLERGVDAGLQQAEENRAESVEITRILLHFDEETIDGFFEHRVEVGAGKSAEGEGFNRGWRFEDDRVHSL